MVQRPGGEGDVQVAAGVPGDAGEVLAGELLGVAARVNATRIRTKGGIEVGLSVQVAVVGVPGVILPSETATPGVPPLPLVAVWAM